MPSVVTLMASEALIVWSLVTVFLSGAVWPPTSALPTRRMPSISEVPPPFVYQTALATLIVPLLTTVLAVTTLSSLATLMPQRLLRPPFSTATEMVPAFVTWLPLSPPSTASR